MNTVLRNGFEQPLKDHDFVKKSGSWYSEKQDAVLVVDLQRSDYGEVYYVNLAVWFKHLGNVVFPKEHQCHIRTRLTSLTNSDVQRALDFDDSSLSETDRTSILKKAMEGYGIPFVEACSTIEGVKDLFREGGLSKSFVHRNIKALCGVNMGGSE